MTVEERFNLAKDALDKVVSLAVDMNTVGVWATEEYRAVQILMASLHRAMNILDPDEYRRYYGELTEKYKDLMDKYGTGAPTAYTGQYL